MLTKIELQYKGLKEGYMIWWNQDQLPKVRWTQVGVEKAKKGFEW